MSGYLIVKNEDIDIKYNEDGFFMTEVLAGSYDGGIRNYKCFLKAGSEVRPALYREIGRASCRERVCMFV